MSSYDKESEFNSDLETQPLVSGNRAKGEQYVFQYSRTAVAFIFLFPALGGLLFGYDIGSTSSILLQLESKSKSGTSWYDTVDDSTLLQGLITSLGVGGAMIGSLICFRIGDQLGRRLELIIAAMLFTAGALIQYTSGGSFGSFIGIFVLLLGRIVYGTGCGFAMHGAPAYLGEMSPPAIRGFLVSLKEAFIVIGMLLGYSVGYAYENTTQGWRYTFLFALWFSIPMLVGCMYLPPSARWLLMKGRKADARKALRFVDPRVPEELLSSMQASIEDDQRTRGTEGPSLGDLWADPSTKPALVGGLGVVLLQQITGQPSVLYYADAILEDVGLDMIASIGVASFKLVATLVAVVNVDKWGRVVLLKAGIGLMTVALVILTIAFSFTYVSSEDCEELSSYDSCTSEYGSKCSWDSSLCLYDTNCTLSATDDSSSTSDLCECCDVSGLDGQKIAILLALFLYIGGYQVGFGPIAWLLISELFPNYARTKAVSVAVVTNFLTNLIVTFIFPSEIEYLGSALTFGIFALLSVYAYRFVSRHVPETKGLTLEEIQRNFGSMK